MQSMQVGLNSCGDDVIDSLGTQCHVHMNLITSYRIAGNFREMYILGLFTQHKE